MRKNKIIFIALAALTAVIVLLHFVPVYSKFGYIEGRFGNVCIGYNQPNNYNYRLITGGLSKYKNINFKPSSRPFNPNGFDDPANATCAEPTNIRIYVF